MAATMIVPIRQAALRLGVHENTVRNWIDRQIIVGHRLPSGVRRIPASELERLEREMFAVPAALAPEVVRAAPRQSDHDDLVVTTYPNA